MLRRTAPRIAILGLLLAVSACSLLPEAKPVQSWPLLPAVEQRSSSTQVETQMSGLRVLRPQVQDLLSSSYMLVKPESQPISVYEGNRWSASTPQLWRDYLVSALQNDARFARISNDDLRVVARYELVSRLDAFQSEYRDGRPVAVIQGYLQLVDANSRAIVAERALALTQPAEGSEVAAVVDAFSSLMERASDEIKRWLLQSNPD